MSLPDMAATVQTPAPRAAKRIPVDSTRKTALVAGVFYLITFISIPTLATLFGGLKLGSPLPEALPVAAWELSLGVWLVVKASGPARSQLKSPPRQWGWPGST